ncbi:RpiB/LacA/LacB family sugar-phosphate isomerase [Candidatus Uhrbacteria bacterium]|nr:RpiB/LacA/LacB family sugar-phosphate isomerase [Candidatus Uhrbacteria bacterium]
MLYIASDHAGFALKEYLKRFLKKHSIAVEDIGAHRYDKADDFPRYAFSLSKKVASDSSHRGILLCGSGQGMCIAANKVRGIRAASVWNKKSAIASRHDDDTNILCLSGRMLTRKETEEILSSWLFTGFSGLARYKRRLNQIAAYEKNSRA